MVKIKQVELAKATGLSEATISRILAGKRRPSWHVAKKLAAVTGTEANLWMENNGQAKLKAMESAG